MRKIFITLAALLALVLITSCGGSRTEDNGEKAEFDMHTFTADTVCMLFGNKGGKGDPSCNVEFKIRYAEGNDAAFINNIITRSIFPDVNDSTSLEDAAHRVLNDITTHYMSVLKGVTRKSITEGTFPLAFAQYRRNVSTSCSTIKSSVLAYSADNEEKAFGEADSIVSQHNFNISLTSRSIITLDDIFVQGYKDRLTKHVTDRMADVFKTKGIDGLKGKGIFTDGIPYVTENFIIGNDNITFIYNPFEAAGRRYGIIKIEIAADDLADIMKKEWISFFNKK